MSERETVFTLEATPGHGALEQQRLLVIAPCEPSADDLAAILRASLQ
jgi:hypothetical protein